MRNFQEKFLCRMDMVTWFKGNYVFSPDLLKVAHWEPEDTLYINDRLVDKYDGFARGMKFSPDGERLAYGVRHRSNGWRKKERAFIIVDGAKGEDYDGIINDSIAFSPDSQHLAYGAESGGMQFVVCDEVEQKRWSEILGEPPVFSPDSRRLAYVAKRDSEWFVVVDEKKGEAFEGIIKPIDAQHRESFLFDHMGNHFAYIGYKSGTYYVVHDHKVIDTADSIRWLAFQPGTEKLAYLRKKKDRYALVIGEEIVAEHLLRKGFTFSPNGLRLGYAFNDGNSLFTSMTPVVDDKVFREMNQVYGFAFSTDSKRFCCYGKRQEKSVVLLDDGREWEHDGEIKRAGVIPSSDGSHFAYCVRSGQHTQAVIDGDGGPERVEVLATPVWMESRCLRYPIATLDLAGEAVTLVDESIS